MLLAITLAHFPKVSFRVVLSTSYRVTSCNLLQMWTGDYLQQITEAHKSSLQLCYVFSASAKQESLLFHFSNALMSNIINMTCFRFFISGCVCTCEFTGRTKTKCHVEVYFLTAGQENVSHEAFDSGSIEVYSNLFYWLQLLWDWSQKCKNWSLLLIKMYCAATLFKNNTVPKPDLNVILLSCWRPLTLKTAKSLVYLKPPLPTEVLLLLSSLVPCREEQERNPRCETHLSDTSSSFSLRWKYIHSCTVQIYPCIIFTVKKFHILPSDAFSASPQMPCSSFSGSFSLQQSLSCVFGFCDFIYFSPPSAHPTQPFECTCPSYLFIPTLSAGILGGEAAIVKTLLVSILLQNGFQWTSAHFLEFNSAYDKVFKKINSLLCCRAPVSGEMTWFVFFQQKLHHSEWWTTGSVHEVFRTGRGCVPFHLPLILTRPLVGSFNTLTWQKKHPLSYG